MFSTVLRVEFKWRLLLNDVVRAKETRNRFQQNGTPACYYYQLRMWFKLQANEENTVTCKRKAFDESFKVINI